MRKNFDNSTWNKAQARYFGALPAIIANLYSPKALNLTDGIIKLLRVVDIDNMLELKGVESATDRIRKFVIVFMDYKALANIICKIL